MLRGFEESLDERLRLAEEAESEVTRLQPLAEDAAQLRLEKARKVREQGRASARKSAMDQANLAAEAASERQSRVPELLGTAARAVNELYLVLREVDSHRREAMRALSVADRIDYEIELEEGEQQEASMDRDTRGLAYALAAKHGDARVKRLSQELDPGFDLLRGCNMDDPLYQDVANFILERLVSPAKHSNSGDK